MGAEANLSTPIAGAASIDFANQFTGGVNKLREVLGVTRELPVAVGGSIKVYTNSITLATGTGISAGDIIPLSKVVPTVAATKTLAPNKHRKAVPVEDIMAAGYERAIAQTDRALLGALYGEIKGGLIGGLADGTASVTGETLQAVLAKARAAVGKVFEDMDVQSVAFIAHEDLADYQATHTITLESENGLQYLKNFMGFDTVIVSGNVEAGTAYATAAGNLVFAYNEINGEVTQAFPAMAADPDFPAIGVMHEIQPDRLTAETITLSSTVIFAENLAGVVVGSIEEASV